MKKLSMNQMEMIEGGTFWGRGTTTDCSLYKAGVSSDCLVCHPRYYFWIEFGSREQCSWVGAEFV